MKRLVDRDGGNDQNLLVDIDKQHFKNVFQVSSSLCTYFETVIMSNSHIDHFVRDSRF